MPSPIKRSSTGTRVVFIMSTLGIGFMFLLSYMSYANVHGREFCPNTFSERSFSYYRLPFTKARLTSTTLTAINGSVSSDVLRFLQNLPQPTVWHVTHATQYRQESFPAKVLVESLAQRNADGKDFWGAWSNTNSQRAAILWPLIQLAAYHELYFVIPEMLECAEQSPNADLMERELFQRLADALSLAQDSTLTDAIGSSETKRSPSDPSWFLELQPKSASQSIQSEIRAIQEALAARSNLNHP